jgi:NAD(P)-dependent dehydrogenase (short-subunit alcohol dehydrogenase family)
MKLVDKHIVITGAASGIGRAMALRFAREGARGIVIADIDASGLDAVAREIEPIASVFARSCDVSRRADIEALVDMAHARFETIDLFCANAGIGGGAGLEDTSDEEWTRAFDVNVRAHVIAAELLIPAWVERGEGYFLSTASAAGLLTVVGSAPYAVTKHGVVAFAEWLAITYGDRGVHVSCLCPMGVRTPMLDESLAGPGEVGAGGRIVVGSGPVLDPAAVAETVVDGLASERFLILPHPEVQSMFGAKASDHDKWIAAMRRLRTKAGAGAAPAAGSALGAGAAPWPNAAPGSEGSSATVS